ncbi:MAG: hypothetical protein M3Q56_13115 [Bacteroidota bacterium]|nr:hypothetical protein [Bacteroidota bacterium]
MIAVANIIHVDIEIIRVFLFPKCIPSQILEILESDKTKYLLVDGRLDLFEWQGTRWVNISKSKSHGFNFRSKKFLFHGVVYNFGGYGFWKEHGGLIYFDKDREEWETSILHYDADIGNNVSFLTDSILYVFNPISRNQTINSTEEREGLFEINLVSHEVRIREIDPILKSLKFATRIETKNFFMPAHNPLQLIDKNSFQYKISDLTLLEALYHYDVHSLYWIRNDSLTIQFHDEYKTPITYDLNKIYRELPIKEKPVLKSGLSRLSISCIILFLLIGSVWGYWKWTSNRKTDAFISPLIPKLLEYSGQMLNQEDLDKILGIDTIFSADTLKSRRATLYKDLNQEYMSKMGKELIIRTPHPMDKRRYLYQVV